MNMKKRSAILCKSLAFLLLLCMLFFYIQDLFFVKSDFNFQVQCGFFEEPKDSLDVVYIGASPVYTSWLTPIVYKKYGITSWGYANAGQPFTTVQNFLEVAYEQQPNAVFMICINGLYRADDVPVESIHVTTDPFKPSFEKLKLIHRICHDFQSTPEEYLEILFPMVRYHSRWNAISAESFHPTDNGYKGADYFPLFFQIQDISKSKLSTDVLGPLPSFTEDALNELLDYCTRNDLKVVFVLSAQYRDQQTTQWYNTMVQRIEETDFPLINEYADFDTIGLDDTVDFFDAWHTNIHGALKVTDYLAQYLLAHYDFPEKSGGGGVRKLECGL